MPPDNQHNATHQDLAVLRAEISQLRIDLARFEVGLRRFLIVAFLGQTAVLLGGLFGMLQTVTT